MKNPFTQNLLQSLLFVLPVTAQVPENPISVRIIDNGITSPSLVGSEIDVIQGNAVLREANTFYSYSIYDPPSSLDAIDIPVQDYRPKAHLFQGFIYFVNKQNQILQYDPAGSKSLLGVEGDEKSVKNSVPAVWFEPFRKFHTFKVLDSNRVALLWVADIDGVNEKFNNPDELALLSLVEVWDVVNNEMIHRVKAPEDITCFFTKYSIPFYPQSMLFASTLDDNLLICFPTIAQVYNYQHEKRRLSRVDTPWVALDDSFLSKHQHLGTINVFAPANKIMVCPSLNGGLFFTYRFMGNVWKEFLENTKVSFKVDTIALIDPSQALRAKPDKIQFFFVGEFKPNQNTIKSYGTMRDFHLDDNGQLVDMGKYDVYWTEGIFMNDSLEPVGYQGWFSQLKAERRKRTTKTRKQ